LPKVSDPVVVSDDLLPLLFLPSSANDNQKKW
jgi:hypothetical protein